MQTHLTYPPTVVPRVRAGAYIILLVGLLQIVSSIQFLFANFGDRLLERGITLNEVGVTKAQVAAFNADLVNYISHLHIAIAGYGMSLGLMGVLVAWFGIRHGVRWAWWLAVLGVSVAAVIGIPAHFVYGLATVGHLGPTFVVLGFFALGAALSYPGSRPPEATGI